VAHGSKLAVGSAIVGNSLLTVAKTAAFLVTGSAAMLSEALHSLADAANQGLLMVGIVRSGRLADPRFPHGYGAERYVWSLLSAVGIFFLGCGVTVYHGVHTLLHPGHLSGLGWAIAVLLMALILEGAVLAVAVKAVRTQAAGKPFFAYLQHEADPTAAAVVLEDSAACLGVLLAMAGILLSRLTGKPAWDSLASILIGLLMGALAIWLIARNRHLLIGPAIPEDARSRIAAIIASSPVVERIARMRTRVLGVDTYRVSAEVDFSGDTLAAGLEEGLRDIYPEIRSYEDFRDFAARYADELLDLLGEEIDRIEAAIREEVPEAQFLDLEAD